jgi:hypothetical protein
MASYHGPKDYLDAARSDGTSVAELMMLAQSEYGFVRLAVARNPNASSAVLASLLPATLSRDSDSDQEIALAVARHDNAPVELLERLASALAPHLRAGREHLAFAAGVELCANPAVPFSALEGLLSPACSPVQFRKVVARDSRRRDVLDLLLSDPSSIVATRAKQTLSQLNGGARDA